MRMLLSHCFPLQNKSYLQLMWTMLTKKMVAQFWDRDWKCNFKKGIYKSTIWKHKFLPKVQFLLDLGYITAPLIRNFPWWAPQYFKKYLYYKKLSSVDLKLHTSTFNCHNFIHKVNLELRYTILPCECNKVVSDIWAKLSLLLNLKLPSKNT